MTRPRFMRGDPRLSVDKRASVIVRDRDGRTAIGGVHTDDDSWVVFLKTPLGAEPRDCVLPGDDWLEDWVWFFFDASAVEDAVPIY